MSLAPLRYCPIPHCRVLVRVGRCEAHGGASSSTWGTDRPNAPRLRGRANQARRRRIFAREPLCRVCRSETRTAIATVIDHVIPLAEGGTDTDANLQPLCDACHHAKSQAEARRGRARAENSSVMPSVSR